MQTTLEDGWDEFESEDEAWLAEANAIAIRPLLAAAFVKLKAGETREGLYQLAVTLGYAGDQTRRSKFAGGMCRRLSGAFDRLWLITAPSPRQQHYPSMVAEPAA